MMAGYGYSLDETEKRPITEGLLSEAIDQQQSVIVDTLPEAYFQLSTSFGAVQPSHLLLFPIVYQDKVLMVLEYGFIQPDTASAQEFLQVASESMAVSFQAIQTRQKIDRLLEETQAQAEQLQAQEEELRTANEEMVAQTESLRMSQAQLREKQAEMDRINATLRQQLIERERE